MSRIRFRKMHGLGNDFIVIDARRQPGLALQPAQIAAMSDRRLGIGADQVVVLEAGAAGDVFMRIYNPDGKECEACGNATRCVGALLLDESGADQVSVDTLAGVLVIERAGEQRFSVYLRAPGLQWDEIPVAAPVDTLHLPVARGELSDPVGTSMGNPHATFFVDDLARVDIAALGPALECDPFFPQRANIGVAQVLAPDRIRLRVWERGPGLTLACGTGSCAALVAAARRGLTGRHATLVLDGGSLDIAWLDDGRVRMTGGVSYVFEGVLSLAD